MPADQTEQHEAMLAAIVDSSEDAIISKNLDGIITSWNKSAGRLFGYSPEEAIGKHISLLIPPERLPEEDMIMTNLRAGQRIEHFETYRRTKSGTNIPLSLTVSPIKNMAGTIIGASKIARDISKQKEVQQLLENYAERLELINSIGRSILSDLNAESILQKVTDATTRLAGAAFGAFYYNIMDVTGRLTTQLKLSGVTLQQFEAFDIPRNRAVFSETFNGEKILRSDNITKDSRFKKIRSGSLSPAGEIAVLSYLAVPVISQAGVVVGGLFFGHPEEAAFKEEHENFVTAIALQAAIALDNAKHYAEIQQLNAQKDEFIGFASHELKTPLTTAIGYVDLILHEPSASPIFIKKIGRQMNRLSAIINELLDISRIESGRLHLNPEKYSISKLVKNSVEALGEQINSRRVIYELPEQEVTVLVDRVKMEQVLVNLLSNAVKYSPPEKDIHILVEKKGSHIELCVKDFGKGISPEHKEKIFQRFYRVAKTADHTEGLGLGLYISKGIVDAHAGSIWVISEQEKGATFHLSLPVDA